MRSWACSRWADVPDLRRLAGRVASRWNVRWAWLWTFLGFCLLAAMVVGGVTADLSPPPVAAAAAKIPRPVKGPAGLPQRSSSTSRTSRWSASRSIDRRSVTTTPPPEGIRLTVSFRSDTPGRVHGLRLHRHPDGARFLHHHRNPGRRRSVRASSRRSARVPGPRRARTPDHHLRPAEGCGGRPVGQLTAASLTAIASYGRGCPCRSARTPPTCARSQAPPSPPTRPTFCTITASQGGSDHYAAARPVRQFIPGARRNQPADDHLRPAAGCDPRPAGHLVGLHGRGRAPGRVVPLRLAHGVQRLGLQKSRPSRSAPVRYRVPGWKRHLRASAGVGILPGQ